MTSAAEKMRYKIPLSRPTQEQRFTSKNSQTPLLSFPSHDPIHPTPHPKSHVKMLRIIQNKGPRSNRGHCCHRGLVKRVAPKNYKSGFARIQICLSHGDDGTNPKEAVYHCEDCQKYLCRRCYKEHGGSGAVRWRSWEPVGQNSGPE